MKCREFEAIAADLARGLGLEESVRRDAAAHASGCRGCAARLTAELELADALGTFAASMKARAAPERVEAALLGEFGRRAATRPARRLSFALPRWAFAAAGLALAGAAVWLLRPRAVVAPVLTETRPAVAPVPPRAEPLTPAPVPGPVVRAARRRPAQPRREVATRFYPLTPVVTQAELRDGAVVRIGLPRSALASFGWPLDPDNRGGRVEAEVVLDNDTGMARAIRFVSSRQ
jgi:hypothetical protein